MFYYTSSSVAASLMLFPSRCASVQYSGWGPPCCCISNATAVRKGCFSHVVIAPINYDLALSGALCSHLMSMSLKYSCN